VFRGVSAFDVLDMWWVCPTGVVLTVNLELCGKPLVLKYAKRASTAEFLVYAQRTVPHRLDRDVLKGPFAKHTGSLQRGRCVT
jgi:hypothetical protein